MGRGDRRRVADTTRIVLSISLQAGDPTEAPIVAVRRGASLKASRTAGGPRRKASKQKRVGSRGKVAHVSPTRISASLTISRTVDLMFVEPHAEQNW